MRLQKDLKILTLVAWGVEKAERNDLSKLSADIFVKGEGYWFLKHWPRKHDSIDVQGLSRLRWLRFVEQRLLKFYLFHAIWYFLQVPKYDLVICFHSQIGLPLAFLLALFQIKKPIILLDVEGLGRKGYGIIRFLIKSALRKISLIFYFSSIQMEDYQARFPEIVTRCKFITLGLDPAHFKVPSSSPENYIVAVGYRFRDWKTLIQAYAKIQSDVPLVIVGKEGLTKNEIEDAEIPKGVKFIGKVSLFKLNEIVGKSKFVILPLPERRHSCGAVTLLGAQALGKAVLTSRVSGVIDYITPGKTGFFYEKGNSDALAAGMAYLLKNPDIAERAGKMAQECFQQRFSEARMGTLFSEETIRYFGQQSVQYRTLFKTDER